MRCQQKETLKCSTQKGELLKPASRRHRRRHEVWIL